MPFADLSYLQLPESFYRFQYPVPVKQPELIYWNQPLAEELGLEPDLQLYAGNRIPEDLTPISQAYAGHQFGHPTMLGDGRAVLLGEVLTRRGRRMDVQLKGSGRTPFSRGGDGRAAVEPMLREVLISEAMHALGIPSTRSLAVCRTGEEVLREKPLPGAVLTRVASSHLRVGTFEYAAALEDPEALSALLRVAVVRHDPGCGSAREFLRGVIRRQAALVAKWMAVGFVHGVMNTDNMAVSGETIDYGPCAFMDRYDPDTVFSSIDQQGRYAYANQPQICHWNLAVLAGTLLPLLHPVAEKAEEMARECLEEFPTVFRADWQRAMNAKLGLSTVEEGDERLVGELLDTMQRSGADYTRTFYDLDPATPLPGFADWHLKWQKRLETETGPERRMREHNPAVIPRNHQVETALHAAGKGDLEPFLRLMDLLSDPFNRARDYGALALPPPPDAPPVVTFCGT
ncbi:MAG: protein adenylyltransferase SelO [Kiritimatiellia bacterium]